MTESTPQTIDPAVAATSAIMTAYLERNAVPAIMLPGIVAGVRMALCARIVNETEPQEASPTAARDVAETQAAELRKPAVPIDQSVTPDAIISLIDGKPYQTLRRHLATNGYTPESYRSAFGLPANYPIVAASCSAKRSALAKQAGLGNRPGKTDLIADLVANTSGEATAADAPKTRSRRAEKQPEAAAA